VSEISGSLAAKVQKKKVSNLPVFCEFLASDYNFFFFTKYLCCVHTDNPAGRTEGGEEKCEMFKRRGKGREAFLQSSGRELKRDKEKLYLGFNILQSLESVAAWTPLHRMINDKKMLIIAL